MDINTKNIAVLFHGKLRDKELPYRNDISCLVLRHFNDNYPNFNIDYFGHIWCENNLDYTCYGNNIISEKNTDYYDTINMAYNKCINVLNNSNSISNTDGVKGRMFAQISNLISISKVIDLFNDKKKKTYEYIILFRYDYIVFENIQILNSIDNDTFYLNKHGAYDTSGESVFILSENKLHYFQELLQNVLDAKVIPVYHLYFYDYFVNVKKMNYKILDYNVGVNCEQVSLLHLHDTNPVLFNYIKNSNILLIS
jgi:hypothetical protein